MLDQGRYDYSYSRLSTYHGTYIQLTTDDRARLPDYRLRMDIATDRARWDNYYK